MLVDTVRGRLLSSVTFTSRRAMDAGRDRERELHRQVGAGAPGTTLTDVSGKELVLSGGRAPGQPG